MSKLGSCSRGFAALLLVAAGVLADSRSAHALESGVRVRRDEANVVVDVRCGGLVDEDVRGALLSGLPARVRLRVELWAERGVLWDELVLSYQSELRVVYLLLDERFDVIDESDEVVLSTHDVDELARWFEEVRDLPLGPLEAIANDRRHYVSMSLRLDPLTVEQLRDLRRWLRGTIAEADAPNALERFSGQLLGVVKGRLGLGDRECEARSQTFRARDLRADDAR